MKIILKFCQYTHTKVPTTGSKNAKIMPATQEITMSVKYKEQDIKSESLFSIFKNVLGNEQFLCLA